MGPDRSGALERQFESLQTLVSLVMMYRFHGRMVSGLTVGYKDMFDLKKRNEY